MPAAGLTDVQKSDLAKIWATHSAEILSDSTATTEYESVSRLELPLQEHTMQFVARLTCLFLRKLHEMVQHPLHGQGSISNKSNNDIADENDSGGGSHSRSCVVEAFRPFLPKACFSMTAKDKKDPEMLLIPRLSHGKYIVNMDHGLFLQELEEFEGDTYIHPMTGQKITFGSFLYHKTDHGLCATNSAIALTLVTLQRRAHLYLSRQQHPSSNAHVEQHVLNSMNNSRQDLQSLINAHEGLLVHVRYYNVYPTIEISEVKTDNAYKLITLRGRIIKVNSKRLRLLRADILCLKCGQQFQHMFVGGRYELPPRCNLVAANGKKCPGQKFELLRRTAKYIDCQMLKLQEEDTFDSVAGRTPRHIDLEVTNDLVDVCHAGDCVSVVGVIHAMNSAVRAGKRGKQASETSTYHLFIKANSIINTTAELHEKKMDPGAGGSEEEATDSGRGLSFSDEQMRKIVKVAHADHMFGPLKIRMAFPFDLLVRSLCPSIIGHDMVKAGILLGLLGGTPPSSSGLEDIASGVSIRSSIHCLIVGDPGMGKSCLLLAATNVAARSIYVGGNTSSTTGLTVSLSKEAGGEIGIEAGALVLADQGVCCIDEFDKMAKTNQDGLLEAMEQQQISIAKAGVVASLPARSSIIAAANPKNGKYDMDKTVAENLNVASPLLSRFDLVFILRDDVDVDQDRLVSGSIIGLYREPTSKGFHHSPQKPQLYSDPSSVDEMSMKRRLSWVASTQEPLPKDLVKDYISYAREYCMPKLTPDAAAVLKDYFMSLRYPENGIKRNDSVPITTRQLEALIRLAQARAKACLREYVLKEDAEDVVELMRDSVNQIHMDSSGRLDRTRGGVGGKSKRKQKKEFIDYLRRSNQKAFTKDDFYRVSNQLNLPLNDFWSIVDELRYCDQPELRKGVDGMYYLL